jgi:hypothetical protein
MYEEDTILKYHGVTFGGINKTIKDTTDMIIPSTKSWEEISSLLSKELQSHLNQYINTINQKDNFLPPNNYGMTYSHLNGQLHVNSNFMIQKYEKEKGKYTYHTDGTSNNTSQRVITFLWYLNDVEEGGETEFFGGSFQIKPETGKILLFPATWTFPHRGNCPISSDKYIITGWLYKENEKALITKSIPVMGLTLLNGVDIPKYTRERNQFDFLYLYNKKAFQFYKYDNLIPFSLHLYNNSICEWLFKELKKIEKNIIDEECELLPYLLFNFAPLDNILRIHYNLQVKLNIKRIDFVYLAVDEEYREIENNTIKHDFCVQIDLKTGIGYFEKKYRIIQNSLVYFIEFSFDFVDEVGEKRNILLRDIAEPFLDLIEPYLDLIET